jgi:hypothetical protein
MSMHPPRSARGRRVSLAGLLALIAAIAVALAWFLEESRWISRGALVMLAGFALAAAIMSLSSPTQVAASIRLAVGSALLLVSVAWDRLRAEAIGWQYHSVFHWVGHWALATVVLPLLLGPGLARAWATSGRGGWVDRLRQVPAGFLLFLLAMLLSLAFRISLDALAPRPPRIIWTGPRVPVPGSPRQVRPRAGRGVAPSVTRPPGATRW